MGKICCIFNIPSLYREAIYLEIDRTYDCEWYFEQEDNDINLFDTTQLKSVCILEHGKFLSRFYRMKGLTRMTWNRKEIDSYLMLGSPICISIWILCILLKLFHPKKKIYFWTHGWYGKETGTEHFIKKLFLKLADELIIYGNYAKGLLIKQGFDEKKIHVIHNSLSYNVQLKLRQQVQLTSIYREHFRNNNPILIFIGRLTPIKRLDILINAVDKLKQLGQNYNLVVIGDGIERKALELMVHRLGLQAQVWFYGTCYNEKTNAELIYNADLCVSPGNIGLTAMHVLMFGCPAITHNDFACQMPEFEAIRRYKTGNFFENENVDSLVKSINEWFKVNRDMRDEVREYCYKEIDEQWNPSFQMMVLNTVLK